jgi:Helix-turn-helix domain of resolvase
MIRQIAPGCGAEIDKPQDKSPRQTEPEGVGKFPIARGQSIGRPKALTDDKVALAQRVHDGGDGESATTIATTLGVSRATNYRVLAEGSDE